MKNMRTLFLVFLVSALVISAPLSALAADDLVLSAGNVRFSTTTYLEGKAVRIYATITNPGTSDLRGVVRFFDGDSQIQGDQPISVLSGKEDSVFVDWVPSFAGEHAVRITVVPFERPDTNPGNNSYTKTISVQGDADRDGKPNTTDPDDDNDGVEDALDSFPLNKNESKDTDGDGDGDNEDDDDDNDGVKDADDALPLNPMESTDFDKDSIGDTEDTDDDGDGLLDSEEGQLGTNMKNPDSDGDGVNDKQDAYPLDPTQALDYDKDGISDEKDNDADSDGIEKSQDVNDANLGPVIKVTSNGDSPTRFAYPDQQIMYEVTKSTDPDGSIERVLWGVDGTVSEGNTLNLKYDETGQHEITTIIYDDKQEPREVTFRLFVIPVYLPWLVIPVILLLIILALFFIFSYSKPRRSRFDEVINVLDTINKAIPKAKKRRSK